MANWACLFILATVGYTYAIPQTVPIEVERFEGHWFQVGFFLLLNKSTYSDKNDRHNIKDAYSQPSNIIKHSLLAKC